MRPITSTCAALGVVAGLTAAGQAITIELDYSYDDGFFTSNAAARSALEHAAGYFEVFTDDLDAISPGGINEWTASFMDPGTGMTVNEENLTIAADTLRIYAGARELGTNAQGHQILGRGGPGSAGGQGTSAWIDTISSRGEPNTDPTGTPTDFGPWGGAITFDTSTNWHFGIADGPGSTELDFLSVALHELGHLFGFGSRYVDQDGNPLPDLQTPWQTWINDDGEFTGPASVAEHGSTVPLYVGSHWDEDTESELPNGTPQEAAMDPDILPGTRKLLTRLDYAGFADIGWEVPGSAIPEPGSLALLAAGTGFAAARRRRWAS